MLAYSALICKKLKSYNIVIFKNNEKFSKMAIFLRFSLTLAKTIKIAKKIRFFWEKLGK